MRSKVPRHVPNEHVLFEAVDPRTAAGMAQAREKAQRVCFRRKLKTTPRRMRMAPDLRAVSSKCGV